MKHCVIFSRELFYFTVVSRALNTAATKLVCFNILRVKAVNDFTADYTTRQLRKHGVIKVCSIEYLTIDIELVLPTFKSWTLCPGPFTQL